MYLRTERQKIRVKYIRKDNPYHRLLTTANESTSTQRIILRIFKDQKSTQLISTVVGVLSKYPFTSFLRPTDVLRIFTPVKVLYHKPSDTNFPSVVRIFLYNDEHVLETDNLKRQSSVSPGKLCVRPSEVGLSHPKDSLQTFIH